MREDKNRVCPVEAAGSLDNWVRKLIHNPKKILSPYINEGMKVLDIGCGPGFFTIEMAKMVGQSGKVIAADLQDGMLEKIKDKVKGTELEQRIIIHKTEKNRINISENVDFALAFYMIHEVPDKVIFFNEIKSILFDNGRLLIVEPPFHVTKKDFNETISIAKAAGFSINPGIKLFFDHSAVLLKR